VRHHKIRTAGLVAFTLVLAACGGGGGGNPFAGTSTQPPTSRPSAPETSGGSPSSAAPVQPSFDAAVDAVANPSHKTGGTLQLLAETDCDSWDPQRTYNGYCWNLQRLFTRTLIGYAKVNGSTFQLGADLATGLGTHNAAYTEWSYTLKSGLKWSDGTPITARDVQYGISRLWATAIINGGPASYFLSEIKAPAGYQGPYRGGGLNDAGMAVHGNTITFHLTSPDADFDYLLALPAAAPVPYRTEGGHGYVGANYGKHPMSSGPFQISSYTPGQQITFTRNPHWRQSTDSIRHPLVDGVDLRIDPSATDVDQKLQAGSADADAMSGVSAAFQARILTDPQLKRNADNPVWAGLKYLAVVPSVIGNVHCRRAVFYASDKAALLRAFGGAVAGQIAGSLSPPGIPGYNPSYDPYATGTDHGGDLARARAELRTCGKPTGFTTKIAYWTPDPQVKNAFVAEQQALARVGIKVSPVTGDAASYFPTLIGSPRTVKAKGIGIAFDSWGADFPTGVGFFQAIAAGDAISSTGNANVPSLNDPVVNKILAAAPAGKASSSDWAKLNQQIMNDAVYVPLIWGKRLYYRNPRLTNITCNNAQGFGAYDFVNVGVRS
jgi:peptide/nickel transport system substrate-binding protein